MKFCSQCGHPVHLGVPAGDSVERHICGSCGTIHYHNPKVIVGCLPVWEGRILLCRRSIEPRFGYWTLPCGFMENGETIEEGALREMREEALAEGTIQRLFAVFSLPHIAQVYALFLVDLHEGRFGAGAETSEARLFAPDAIPWDDLAFRAVEFGLRKYLAGDSGAATHLGAYAGSFRHTEGGV
ncbi:MAG: NUDIX hydrolase [Candidatus Eisenbacteria bacterium]|uniref:NUDIX hydrolase n=1 Tax=Eiseniibacteriota bacterium TaxID=2212470 RepID=A0A956M0G1_UNCEI|nr:NUDIX hydrolase [Candidatus Eisenbacteria bacterium]